MNKFFFGLLKLLGLIIGTASIGVSAYLSYSRKIDCNDWGWFLFVGFAIIIANAIWAFVVEYEESKKG